MTEQILGRSGNSDLKAITHNLAGNWIQLNRIFFITMSKASAEYLRIMLKNKDSSGLSFSEKEKEVKSRLGQIFDKKFRDEEFINNLSCFVENCSDLARITGLGEFYQIYSDYLSTWNNEFLEPIRDRIWRTPSQKVSRLEKYSLFRYDKTPNDGNFFKPSNSNKPIAHSKVKSSPLLVVYGFINRPYILDLLPEVSVVKNLLEHDLDIYATDWNTPSAYDKDLTLRHFVNNYMDKSVDFIRRTTGSDKVSLLGYCWGGNLVMMYAALHPDKVRNIVTIATPGDFSANTTLLNLWTRNMKTGSLLEAFGNVPSELLNIAFYLRNPIENIFKYENFIKRQPENFESNLEFITTETWLYDSPPIVGEIYREFVKYCYQENLFIKNELKIDRQLVDLGNIAVPFLNVMAQKDDLVAPDSSKALNNVVGSKDKSTIEYPSGHVGLIIGHRAHTEVWSKVADWLKERG
jgi:class III poly(R)-hydroxyalkanoic acid synthase PhaC subunit